MIDSNVVFRVPVYCKGIYRSPFITTQSSIPRCIANSWNDIRDFTLFLETKASLRTSLSVEGRGNTTNGKVWQTLWRWQREIRANLKLAKIIIIKRKKTKCKRGLLTKLLKHPSVAPDLVALKWSHFKSRKYPILVSLYRLMGGSPIPPQKKQ